jgi:vancomycin resistance protein YoaR
MAGFVLVLVAVAIGLTAVPPRYQVWLGAQPAGSGRNLSALGVTLQEGARRESSRAVTLTGGGQSWSILLRDLGLTSSPEQLPQMLQEAQSRLSWWQRLPWSQPALRVEAGATWDTARFDAALAPVRAALETPGWDATFAIVNRQPVITPSVDGTMVDAQALLQTLENLGDRTTVDVPLRARPPAVTTAAVEGMGIRRVVSEWTTQYDPTIPRAENVERAARAFNGKLLKPGEMLSYNATVGPVDEANGWREAFVIVSGELVPGVGGGVCQVATTFYGAALRAGLEILERHQHQLAVSYIDPSQDAAIAQGFEDFKIRNTTLGYLYIETESGGGRVTFRLYGDVPGGQSVQIESRVLGSRPFGTKTVVDSALAPGQHVTKVAGHEGLSSEAYRLFYMNGQVVKRELLSRDNYLPTTAVVATGPAPKPAAQPPSPPPAPEPGPAEPGPVEPGPVEPGPVEPGPTEPGPVEPGPTEPGPVEPGPTEPGPTEPGSTEPGSTEPGPAPQPTEPGN